MIFLDRFRSDDKGTFGMLSSPLFTPSPLCFTCELPWNDNLPDISCIPAGVYDVVKYISKKHGNVWLVKGVVARSNIEIHGGNDINDLLGCICVGNKMGTVDGLPAVLNSQDTLKMLKATLPDNFPMTVVDAGQGS